MPILIKLTIKDQNGKVVDYVLNKPFGCLRELVDDLTIELSGKSGSKQVPFGVPVYTGVAEMITPRCSVIGDLFSLSRSSFVAYVLEEAPVLDLMETIASEEKRV